MTTRLKTYTDRVKGPDVYQPRLETWKQEPIWDYDEVWDYANVDYWVYRSGRCPHDYHTPGWVPTPWPKKSKRQQKTWEECSPTHQAFMNMALLIGGIYLLLVLLQWVLTLF